MSRLLRAGTAGSSPEVDRTAARGFGLQDLPSGLASLVLHFSVLIVLGLVVTESSRPRLSEVVVNWEQGTDELAGGGGGVDGTEDTTEPAAAEEDWTSAADEMAGVVASASDPLLVESQLTSEWGDVAAELEPSLGASQASDALADLAMVGGMGLQSIGTGGGSGGGRGRGQGPGEGDGTGPGSATGVFGVKDEGSRIVYVFDRSESMNSVFTLTSDGKNTSVTFLEAAKSELTKSVGELNDGSHFHMIFYNSYPMAFIEPADKLLKVDGPTKEFAQQFIYQLVAEQNTNHIDALLMALEMKPDVIFLMTDGEAKDDLSSADLRKLTKACRRSKTRINVIHFCFEERPNSPLSELAKRTQGQFKSINIRSLVDPEW
ncbi:MAG TPA: vWA domain-containing protein [Lacipirellulaceae bacterium]|nr:vWA domain-containing protein [Lacipirellulaceae bacterium]